MTTADRTRKGNNIRRDCRRPVDARGNRGVKPQYATRYRDAQQQIDGKLPHGVLEVKDGLCQRPTSVLVNDRSPWPEGTGMDADRDQARQHNADRHENQKHTSKGRQAVLA